MSFKAVARERSSSIFWGQWGNTESVNGLVLASIIFRGDSCLGQKSKNWRVVSGLVGQKGQVGIDLRLRLYNEEFKL